MKKALLIIVAILAVSFLIGNSEMIMDFAKTLATGAVIPLLIATVFMVLRHLIQAISYDAAFEAVGHKTGFMHNVILIFSLVFINTFCLFSGATGLAFIIDDAHREGMDIGTASTGGVLSQLGFFAAVAIISIVGTVAMFLTGTVNPIFVTGGGILACVLLGQIIFLFLGYYLPKALIALFDFVEKILRKVYAKLKKELKENWGRDYAASFIDSSKLLAKNPMGIFYTIAWATLSALFNMACLISIGFAFGFTMLPPLIAAFAVGVVSIMLSPTPQGIGFTEVFIAAILTAYGCSVTTAAAIALVYRGIMLWIPFVIGAVMLSQSGFFKAKKDPTQEQRDKDIAWISGTIMIILGVVSIVLFVNPSALESYAVLVQFVDFSGVFLGATLFILGLVLIVCGIGLIRRYRTFWAVSMAILVFIVAVQVYLQAFISCVVVLALAALLFVKRNVFDRPTFLAATVLHKREQALANNMTPNTTTMSKMSDNITEFHANYNELHESTGNTGKLYSRVQAAEFVRVVGHKARYARPGESNEALIKVIEDSESIAKQMDVPQTTLALPGISQAAFLESESLQTEYMVSSK